MFIILPISKMNLRDFTGVDSEISADKHMVSASICKNLYLITKYNFYTIIQSSIYKIKFNDIKKIVQKHWKCQSPTQY